jgi:hypothetical protein
VIEQQLFDQLTTFPGLAALIGDRAYPAQLPQEVTLPAVTYLRVSEAPVLHRDNPKPGYSRDRFQLDGWANSYDGALAVRKQLRGAMGVFVRSDFPRVDVALPAGGRDAPLEAEPNRWHCTLDYMISHEEG